MRLRRLKGLHRTRGLSASRYNNHKELMKRLLMLLLGAVVAVGLASPAQAADMWIKPAMSSQGQPIAGRFEIFISGEIKPYDHAKFFDLTKNLLPTTNDIFNDHFVNLNSPGGNLVAGLNIGLRIHENQWDTKVSSGNECSSVCGMMWLAGRFNYVRTDSFIGFHAAYNSNGNVSSSGNALAGAYLHEIGLNYQAIRYLTETPPNKIERLTEYTAKKYDIPGGLFTSGG
jgi:hypothetical protein